MDIPTLTEILNMTVPVKVAGPIIFSTFVATLLGGTWAARQLADYQSLRKYYNEGKLDIKPSFWKAREQYSRIDSEHFDLNTRMYILSEESPLNSLRKLDL